MEQEKKPLDVKALIEKGKTKGSLSNSDIMEAIEFADYDIDQIEKIYDQLEANGIEGFTKAATGIPNQTVLTLVGIKWLMVIFSILLFSAFVSTSVTLVFTMIQRFQGFCFPKSIKNEKVRGVIVGVVVIAICFAISLLGLGNIIKYAYGYDGYYAILVIFLPVLIWGLPKVKKLSAAKKAELE